MINWKTKLTLLITSTMTIMSGTAIVASLPMIKENFADEVGVEILSRVVLTAPAIAIAFFAPWSNAVATRFGKKRTLIVALIFFGLFGVMGASMQTLQGMVVSRLLFGISVALMMSLSLSLVGDYLKDEERIRYLGYQNTFVALGGVMFMAGGGLLSQISWQGAFYLYGIGWIVAILAWRYIVEPEKIIEEETDERPSHVMRHWPIFITALATMSVFYMVPSQLPYVLHETYDMPASRVGLLMATVTFVSAITSLFYNYLRKHWSIKAIYSLVFSIQGLGFVGLGLSKTYLQFNLSLVAIGIGVGFVIVNTNSWLLESAQPYERLKATGWLSSSIFMGQFLSPLLLYLPTRFMGISNSFILMGFVLTSVGALLVLRVIRRKYRSLGYF